MAAEVKTSQKEDHETNIKETAKELGGKLRELREAQGLTFEDVRAAIKIQKKYIAAIEEGNIDIIPKGPFCRSFMKQYCEYLRAEDLWVRYGPLLKNINSAANARPGDRSVRAGIAAKEPYRRPSALKICIPIAMALSIVAAAWITWQYRGEITNEATTPLQGGTAAVTEESSQDAAAPAVLSQDAAPASAEPSIDLGWMDGKAQPRPAQAPAPAGAEAKASAPVNAAPTLVVKAKGVVWVKFSIGGKVLFEGLMRQGESRAFSTAGDEPLRVRYGNPAKTAISWAGGEETLAGSDARPFTRYYRSDGGVSDER